MREQRIYDYYYFGFEHSKIIETLNNYRISAKSVNKVFKTFMVWLEEICLPVTLQASEPLKAIVESLPDEEEQPLSREIIDKIKQEFIIIKAVIDAELKIAILYRLEEKRYPLEILLEQPEKLLSKGGFEQLSSICQSDFSSACIQIALNQPTASAFHLMRALEEQVKTLYFAFKKTKRLKKPMWGPMTSELRSKRAPKPTEKLLSHLDGMRIHFRNPTQHPEKFYSMDEAQDLLNQTIVAINMIQIELPLIKKN